MIAAGCHDSKIRLFNLTSGDLIDIITGHTWSVWSLKMIEANKLVSGTKDKTIRIWDIKSKKCIQILEGHKDLPRDFAIVTI